MTKNVTIRKNSQQNKYSKWSQGGAFTTGGVKKNKYSPHSQKKMLFNHLPQYRIHNHQDGCQKGREGTSELQNENMRTLQIWVFTFGPSPNYCSKTWYHTEEGTCKRVFYIWTQPWRSTITFHQFSSVIQLT